MTQTRSFDEIYAGVPADQREELRRFREQHPPYQTDHDGYPWSYIDTQAGEEVVLLLVGGLRAADAAFRSIAMLAGDFRVITPTYPGIGTMAGLADGLAAVLDAAGVVKAHVLAGSFGGMLAQVFVRRHPQRVAKLVLSTTTVINNDSADRYQQVHDMMAPLPPDAVRENAKEHMFSILMPPDDWEAFYRAYLDELYSQRVSKDELLSTYKAIIDFGNYTLQPGDLDDWPGAMLVIESDDDVTFEREMRERVHALYPRAQRHTFTDAGHSPASTQRETYFALVKDFLKKS